MIGSIILERGEAARISLIGALFALQALTTACTSPVAYGAGQQMQRNECNKLVDMQDRQRCMARANTSYEDYKRQADAAKNPS
jgi:hypothetical protein